MSTQQPSPHSVASLDTAASESYEPHVLTAILTDDLLPISGSNVPGAPHAKQISTNSQKPVYVVFAPRPDGAFDLLFFSSTVNNDRWPSVLSTHSARSGRAGAIQSTLLA